MFISSTCTEIDNDKIHFLKVNYCKLYIIYIFLLSQVLVYRLHSVPINFFAWHFHCIWFAQKLLTLLHIWKSFMNTTSQLVVLYLALSVAELILFFKDVRVSHFVCVTCNLQASAGHGCMIWIVSCLALWNVYKYGRSSLYCWVCIYSACNIYFLYIVIKILLHE